MGKAKAPKRQSRPQYDLIAVLREVRGFGGLDHAVISRKVLEVIIQELERLYELEDGLIAANVYPDG